MKEDLITREQYWIDTLTPTFNIAKVAGSCLGVVRSEEYRENQRLYMTRRKRPEGFQNGRVLSQETRDKIGKAHKGRVLTPEHCAKIKLSMKDRPPSSLESNLKRSVSMRGKGSNTKLTESIVREIKILLKEGLLHKELSDRFGVTRSNISAISNGKSWKYVEV